MNFFLLLSLALFLFCKSPQSLFSYANEALRLGGLEDVFQVGHFYQFADSIRDLLPCLSPPYTTHLSPLFSPHRVCLWGHTLGTEPFTSILISSGAGVGEKIIMASQFLDSLTTSLWYHCGTIVAADSRPQPTSSLGLLMWL